MARTVFLFCSLAFLISWTAKFIFCAEDLGWIGTVIPKGVLQLIASFGPSIAGLIMYYLESRRKGLIAVIKSLIKINIHVKWYLFALFFELVSFILIVFSSSITGYRDTPIITNETINSLIMFFANTVTLTLLTGLGEEIGWRGFLLPKFQSRFPVIKAAVILALINSLWHLRTDFLSLLMQGEYDAFISGYLPDMMLRIMISIPVVLILVYLFNNTGGSLFIMILFHGSSNASWEWVKQITGIADPSYLLPLWAALLWFTMLYFIPALKKQAAEKRLITNLYEEKLNVL
jgi:membrane protease YdiL (CAAX protease family)